MAAWRFLGRGDFSVAGVKIQGKRDYFEITSATVKASLQSPRQRGDFSLVDLAASAIVKIQETACLL